MVLIAYRRGGKQIEVKPHQADILVKMGLADVVESEQESAPQPAPKWSPAPAVDETPVADETGDTERTRPPRRGRYRRRDMRADEE